MAKQFRKVNNRTFAVDADVPAQTVTTNYDIEHLVSKKAGIEKQIADAQVELAKIIELIDEAKKVGVEPLIIIP
jgi:hypothetical protein